MSLPALSLLVVLMAAEVGPSGIIPPFLSILLSLRITSGTGAASQWMSLSGCGLWRQCIRSQHSAISTTRIPILAVSITWLAVVAHTLRRLPSGHWAGWIPVI